MRLERTMVHTLHAQAAHLGDLPALWTRRNGSYWPTSWRQYAHRVKSFALGLHGLGFPSGSALTVLGFNREEWLVGDLAAMALGGVPVGIYVTSSPDQIQYVIEHCESPVALVENRKFLDTLLALRPSLPKLRHIVVMEGVESDPAQGVHSYADVLAQGEKADDRVYQERLDALRGEDLATLIYTSGTTGRPKGVMISHQNLTWTAEHLVRCVDVAEGDTILSYLPLSHIAEQICSIHGPIVVGLQVYFAESFEKVPQNLKDVRPHAFFGVPRVWEKFMAKAQEGLRTQPPLRQRLVGWARGVASARHERVFLGQQVPLTLEAQYALAQRLVFAKLKARIGFDRAKVFVTSAAPISREVLEFFASLDIVVREVYGQSEVTGPTSINTPQGTRIGTLGRPMPGLEVRIAEDGEIIVHGGNVCMGYYKDADATSELIDPQGWLHSGDVGEFDADGYLRITGRKKDIIVTSGGKKTAPANIEVMLKGLHPLGNALVVGDRRNYLVALLALDPEKAEAYAREKGLPPDLGQLAAHPAFLQDLDARIEREVNSKLAKFETVKRFAVLPHDFTVEGGELTATLKVKRKVCEEKYSALIEGLYRAEAKSA